MAANPKTNYSFSYNVAHYHLSLVMSALNRVTPTTNMKVSNRRQAAKLHGTHYDIKHKTHALYSLQIHNAKTDSHTQPRHSPIYHSHYPPHHGCSEKRLMQCVHCSGFRSLCLHCIASETWSQVSLNLVKGWWFMWSEQGKWQCTCHMQQIKLVTRLHELHPLI